jgi:long-chain acyl-CoA synthetase
MNLTTPSEEVVDIYDNKINMDMIGVFSKNREEWLLLEYADFLYNFTLVPLYDTLGEDALKLILEQTCIKTIFCSKESV